MANKRTIPPAGMPERITKCMKDRNMNSCQPARILGVDRKRIYDYKNGVSVPNASIVAKMCEVFDVAADYLIFGR